ncbi:NAD-dependent deacylase [Brachymonas sp. G13]|uniref:SIR2 family NAD-dependent protein deacylase n=1 Tax=Brachymonas wangyanguii TaxID=3130163 RepID=UPI00169CE49B|nr:NAD-dependent deacylase [Ramlibacter sp.]
MTTSDTPSRKRCVVLTGAGISADSGLDTFRGAGGLWEGHRVEDVATPEAFARDPQLVLDFYNARRRQLRDVQPNSAHYALAALEEACDVYIVTQNVDNLHERAGSSRVLHLHGELTKLRSQDDEAHVIEWHGDQPPDMKDPAGAPMRPHIVWFGEPVPLIEDAVDLISDADIVMVIGTSLKVYPAAGLVEFAPDDALCVLIDPHPNLGPSVADRELFVVEERAATGVPRVVQALLEQL